MPPFAPSWAEVSRALAGAERWLLPSECLLCERPLGPTEPDHLACAICRSRWVPIPDPVCDRCGQPLDQGLACRLCAGWPEGFTGVRTAVWLEGMARLAVHRLKFDGWWRMADAMAPAMRQLPPLRGTVVLVPVPLGAARRRERGYNQSESLASALGRLSGIPVRADLLRRVRDTERQTRLAPDARQANVAGAFRARRVGERVPVLVDDVFTTGATLAAAAEALLASGSRNVTAVTFARARRPLDHLMDDPEDSTRNWKT